MINLSSFIAFHARRSPDRDNLPRNPSGKMLKRVLRAELEATA